MSERLLEKPVWSEADFDRMEWHDATIYAVGFDAASFELLFDVDYICQWLSPKNRVVTASGSPQRHWWLKTFMTFASTSNLVLICR